MEREIMTNKQMAAYLKMDRATLYRSRVPSFVIPGTRMRRYFKAEVDAWMRSDAKAETQPSAMEVILL